MSSRLVISRPSVFDSAVFQGLHHCGAGLVAAAAVGRRSKKRTRAFGGNIKQGYREDSEF